MSSDEGEVRDSRPAGRRSPSDARAAGLPIRVGSPRVRARLVAPRRPPGRKGPDRFAASYVVSWQPAPTPPATWIDLIRTAPFGSQRVRASNLQWDGKFLSIDLPSESDVEAYAVEIPEWEDYANTQYARLVSPPGIQVLRQAQKRAREIEERLRR